MINLYGIIFALNFVVVFIVIRAYFKSKNRDPELAYTGVIYAVLGTLIGARLFHVFYYYPSYFLTNPAEIFYIWQGGLSFHGGLIGVLISGFIFCRKYKIDFLEMADLIVIPTALFLGFGKIANFFNLELYGKITHVSWCVNFEGVEGCRHPVQLYEAVKNFALFLFLLCLHSKKTKKGVVFLSFIFLYTLLRFFIDFFREYNAVYLGLGSGQFLNLAAFIISGYFLFSLTKNKK